jgi:hypothetical protein
MLSTTIVSYCGPFHGGKSNFRKAEKYCTGRAALNTSQQVQPFFDSTSNQFQSIGPGSHAIAASSQRISEAAVIMPLRVRGVSTPLAGLDAAISLSSRSSSSSPFLRTFSTTPCREKMSKGRARMFEWLNHGGGRNLAEAGTSPNYLGPHQDQPFPLNPLFRSQPVLADQTRELIYDKVTRNGDSLKAVSAEMHIDVRRVAAVVRLKEVEKQMKSEVSTPYN